MIWIFVPEKIICHLISFLHIFSDCERTAKQWSITMNSAGVCANSLSDLGSFAAPMI